MLQMFLARLRPLLKNPMSTFVYGIMAKWYIMITVAAIVVTFGVFSGLKESGFLDVSEKIVSKALNTSKSVARYCVPKIMNLSDFWNCLDSPPQYKPIQEEKVLEESLTGLLKFNSYDQKDPYSEDSSTK